MYIARRDFFLSREASRVLVYTFLTIAVSDRIQAGSLPQSVELAQKIAGRCSQSSPTGTSKSPRVSCSRSYRRLHYGIPLLAFKSEASEQLTNWEEGALTSKCLVA